MHPLHRLLPLLAIAQAAGILLADRVWMPSEIALPLAALALLLGLVAKGSARLRAGSAMVVALCAGAVALEARLDAASFSPAGGVVEATIEGRVGRVGRQVDWMWVELGRVRNLDAAGPTLPRGVRIQGPRTPASLPALESHRVGERIRARVRLKPPRALQNPGSRDRTRSLARRGIGATGQLVHPAVHVEIEASNGAPPWGFLERIRAEGSQRLRAAGPGGGLLAALSLGDRSGLSLEVRDTLARLGLSHLIAVSGLHLTLIAALAYAVGRLAFTRLGSIAERNDPRRMSILVAVGFAAAYALLSGWGVPVRRALVFLIAVAIGFVRRRPGRRGQPLALAAIIVLAFEPGALFEPGAQMSFAASAAILAGLGGRTREDEGRGIGLRIRRGVDALLRTSATAIAATAPLAAVHFGQVAPGGVFANLIAVPLTAAVLLPASLLAAVATLVRPDARLTEWTVSGSAAAASAALRGAEQLASWLPEPPPIPPPSITALLLALLLAVLVTRLRATSGRIALAMAGAALIVHFPAPAVVPRPPRLVALDVGQGDAVVVQGRGATLLFDGGTAFPGGVDLGRTAVVPALAALGITRLDLVIASHADLEVTPLWPPRPSGLSRNEASLVVRVDVGGSRVLLTGDIEAATEAALLASGAELRAEVLELPHHGSRTSATSAFLRAVAPSVAIASAPCPGRFGMPHRVVLDRARALGIPVWWTGRDGAVLVGLAERPVVSGWAPLLRARPGCGSRAGGAQ